MIFYIIIGATTGLVVGLLLYFLSKKINISSKVETIITIVAIAISLSFSKIYLFPYYEAWKFENEIKKIPIFSLIEKANPKEYKIFLTKSKKAIISSNDNISVQKYSAELFSKIFPRYLSVSADKPIYQFLHSLIGLYEYLYRINPSLILDIEFGKIKDYSKLDSDEFATHLNQLIKAEKEVIESAIKNPSMIPTRKEVIIHLEPIIAKLIDQYGKDNISYFISGKYKKLNDKELASIIISFYKEIYSSGQGISGIIIRYMVYEKVKVNKNR